MNSPKSYCEWNYYNQFDSAALFNEVREQINPDITKLEKEFQYLFYKILHTDPCIYWDKVVYTHTISLLENLF